MMTFGEVRALVQQAPGVARDLALCEVLRDTPRATLRTQGMLDYVISALCEGTGRARALAHPGELLRKLRRGELVGCARDGVLDLRGYKRPTDKVFDAVLVQNRSTPIVHLCLDHTMCGADWLIRLLKLGDWSGLRWLSVRGCQLAGHMEEVVEALPGQVVGLMCGGNALRYKDVSSLCEGAKLAGLRWLDVSGSATGTQAFDAFIAGADRLDMELLGMDVSGAQGFGDHQLVDAIDVGLFRSLMVWRSQESGISEFSLPALLWSLPVGQLEVLSFGDARDERATHLDAEAVLGLLDVPACDQVYCLELAYSDVVTRTDRGTYYTDYMMLEYLATKPFMSGLERLGLCGFSLAGVAQSHVLDQVAQIRELSLTQLWCPYEVSERGSIRARRAMSVLTPLLRRALGGIALSELECGLLSEPNSIAFGREWEGWSHEVADKVIHELVEALAHSRLDRLVWCGERGLWSWLNAMDKESPPPLPRCLIKLHDPDNEELTLSMFTSSEWLATCACIETDEVSWSPRVIDSLKRVLMHSSMRRAVNGSAEIALA